MYDEIAERVYVAMKQTIEGNGNCGAARKIGGGIIHAALTAQSAKATKFHEIETRRQRHIVMFALYRLAKDARAKADAAAQDKQHRCYTASAVEMFLRDAEEAEALRAAIAKVTK